MAFLDSKAWICTRPHSNEYQRLKSKRVKLRKIKGFKLRVRILTGLKVNMYTDTKENVQTEEEITC